MANDSLRTKEKISIVPQGFTLIELLIAGSIFSVIALIAVSVFINVARANRRIDIENQIYTEGNILMEKLAREVRKGTIDYEEYHNQFILEGNYGDNYGEYAKKFYHPGYKEENTNPKVSDDFGTVCATDRSKEYPTDCSEDSQYTPSLDKNTGKNPFDGADDAGVSPLFISGDAGSDQATAFCDNNFKTALNNSVNFKCDVSIDKNGNIITASDGSSTTKDFEALHFQKELYLINSDGNQKTIIAREVVNDPDKSLSNATPSTSGDEEYALSLVRLDGTDADQNEVKETWQCSKDFICTSSEKPNSDDLKTTLSHLSLTDTEKNNGEDFVPLTPSSMNVTSVKFLIAPLEDPRKAFGEDDAEADYIFMQPYVTIVLTVRPSTDASKKIFGDPKNFPTITLQTTVSSRVYNEIKSYGE